MLLHAGMANEQELARFRLEAEAVARLNHPNIVQIHELGEYDGKPFFSMEYHEGGTLSNLLKKQRLTPDESASLIETLAMAMETAHQNHIIHRDLKPDNVLITKEGDPKVSDFGLVKVLQEGKHSHSHTIAGTINYMAPEQARGQSELLSSRTDVYALGVILYECLTNRTPFQASDMMEVLRQVIETEPTPPRLCLKNQSFIIRRMIAI